jgi:ABC-type sugar transport system ATPase subunit
LNTILELKDISKSFGPVKVLDGIDMTIEPGKVYVLAGENGAGKSTLCNIISGALQPSSGTVIFGGREHSHVSIDEAKNQIGVRMVHQELQVIPMMTMMSAKTMLFTLMDVVSKKRQHAAERRPHGGRHDPRNAEKAAAGARCMAQGQRRSCLRHPRLFTS